MPFVNRKEDLTLMEEDWVREYLYRLGICKSMCPDRIHLQMLRELPDDIARSFSTTFEQS